jgi:hypothetical protein
MVPEPTSKEISGDSGILWRANMHYMISSTKTIDYRKPLYGYTLRESTTADVTYMIQNNLGLNIMSSLSSDTQLNVDYTTQVVKVRIPYLDRSIPDPDSTTNIENREKIIDLHPDYPLDPTEITDSTYKIPAGKLVKIEFTDENFTSGRIVAISGYTSNSLASLLNLGSLTDLTEGLEGLFPNPAIDGDATVYNSPPSELESRIRERILQVAESKIGSRYVLGKEGPDTFDCSGFVRWSLKTTGVLPKPCWGIANSFGGPVETDLLSDPTKAYGYTQFQKFCSSQGLITPLPRTTNPQPADIVVFWKAGADFLNRRNSWEHVGLVWRDITRHIHSSKGVNISRNTASDPRPHKYRSIQGLIQDAIAKGRITNS